ncbi:MAG: hypothetical protein H0U21_15955 [Acidimicrobiia bacterium]|nr:hypothetical protein [Acidimicrobiia bacterium]
MPHTHTQRRAWRVLLGRAAGIVLVTLVSVPGAAARANHTTIVATDDFSDAVGTWNGFRVFLSSPRHSFSGASGRECGWEENVNGHHWNSWAAKGATNQDNLRQRGYRVIVSKNARDDGWALNLQASNNWGANVHIVTHTNGRAGCPDTPRAFISMWDVNGDNANSAALSLHLVDKVGAYIPTSDDRWEDCDGDNSGSNDHGECDANAPHRSYVELFFHDNQPNIDWFQCCGHGGDKVEAAWRYGWAVDAHLGSP